MPILIIVASAPAEQRQLPLAQVLYIVEALERAITLCEKAYLLIAMEWKAVRPITTIVIHA
jgi:hypothetical protein